MEPIKFLKIFKYHSTKRKYILWHIQVYRREEDVTLTAYHPPTQDTFVFEKSSEKKINVCLLRLMKNYVDTLYTSLDLDLLLS